jgi:hypothetical protein
MLRKIILAFHFLIEAQLSLIKLSVGTEIDIVAKFLSLQLFIPSPADSVVLKAFA